MQRPIDRQMVIIMFHTIILGISPGSINADVMKLVADIFYRHVQANLQPEKRKYIPQSLQDVVLASAFESNQADYYMGFHREFFKNYLQAMKKNFPWHSEGGNKLINIMQNQFDENISKINV